MAPILDLTGQRFGRLVAISIAGRTKHQNVKWFCRCDCGAERVVIAGCLRGGTTISCGCAQKEHAAQHCKSMTKHGMCASGTYSSWASMIARCGNPRAPNYPRYGGRGIVVCSEWLGDFRTFLRDMGERPAGHSLDRINRDLGYESSNCRWATYSDQAKNRRNSPTHRRPPRLYDVDGNHVTFVEIADYLAMDVRSLQYHFRKVGVLTASAF